MKILAIALTTWREVVRRKDAYVLLILMGALLVTLVSLDVFGLGGVVRYVADVGLLMAWLFSWVLAVTVSSRQLPREETRGTVFPLLAKPVSRIELILGKWLGSWSIVTLATLGFYALVVVIVAAKGGRLSAAALLQGFVLHACALAVIAAIGLVFSARMNNDAAASMTFVLTAASFAVVPRVPEFMTHESGFAAGMLMFLYNLMPHFEVFDLRKRIVHDYGPASWRTFLLVVLYALLVTAAFVALAWVAYRRKRFTRSALG